MQLLNIFLNRFFVIAESFPMLPCPFKQIVGIDCPGCGMQRSFWCLIEGHIKESLMLYPALIPTIAMLAYLAFHIKFQFKNGHKVLTTLFIVNLSLIIINYIYKFI